MTRTKKIYAIISIMLPIFITGCQQTPLIPTTEKAIGKSGDNIYAKGRWRVVQDTSKILKDLPKNNTTKIFCNKGLMTYHEETASLWMPKEIKLAPKGFLSAESYDYKITQWTADDTVYIAGRFPDGDVDITISLKDGSAEKRWRGTKARGSDNFTTNESSHYLLV